VTLKWRLPGADPRQMEIVLEKAGITRVAIK
jgi:hypothetical protein